MLWHSVTIAAPSLPELGALRGFPPGGSLRWPIAAVVAASYRLEPDGAQWRAREGIDELGPLGNLATAWALAHSRIRLRALELAMRKGWTAFAGTVLRLADERACLVGPHDERRAATAALTRVGAVIESADGWLSRDGEVLPVPTHPNHAAGAAGTQVVIGAADRVLVWRPPEDRAQWEAPRRLMAVCAAADRSCQRTAEVVRAATALVHNCPMTGSTIWESAGAAW